MGVVARCGALDGAGQGEEEEAWQVRWVQA